MGYLHLHMPVSLSIELGRILMPKADNLWIIYDYNRKVNGFKKAIKIG
ncbi:SAVED domain-containing protein [uncultured Gilliamella sp.]|nr:SAVED domain-containing protein [uncultured Gilliamella sp.]